jgi:DNA primase
VRETEGQDFTTPERRAALEARIGEMANQIADESVRKYYRQDFTARLQQFFVPPPRSGGYEASSRGGFGGPRRERGGERDWRRDARSASRNLGNRATPYLVVSQQLAASPLHRGHRTAIPRREALLLQAALNHPWLLHDHMEDFASLEFRHADSDRLKGAIIDLAAHDSAHEPAALAAALRERGLDEIMERVERAITTGGVWGAGPAAAPQDVLITWGQLVGLHRQWHSLIKELKDAEQALGQDATEANFLRLRDVKARLSKMDGTEALVEGFGLSSGRSSGGGAL